MNITLDDFRKRAEHMLLFQLTLNLKEGKISENEAQTIAEKYLSLNPTSKEELLQGLIDLGYTYQVLQPVIATFSEEFDREFSTDVLSKMHNKMGSGDIDAAIEIGKTDKGVHAA